MSNLILSTVVLPLGLGVLAGLLLLVAGQRTIVGWLLAALVVVLIYWRLESIPPFPPIASKQRLAYVIAIAALLAPLLRISNRYVVGALVSAFLMTALFYIGGNKLMALEAWPASVWLLPLPLLLGFGLAQHTPSGHGTNGMFAPRLALLMLAVGSSLMAMIGGFVGLGQLQGAMAAAIGGTLIVAYAGLWLGRPSLAPVAQPTADWAIGGALAAMVLISASFTPTPDPLALYLVTASLWLPSLVRAPAAAGPRLSPILLGLAAALPAVVAVLIASLDLSGKAQ